MPEGPEVKTVARTLAPDLVGCELAVLWRSEFRLRKEVDVCHLQALAHKPIDEVSAFGKVIFIHMEKKPALLVQLGMTGQLTVENIHAPLKPHTHLRWQLKGSDQELRYVDPRRFGLVDVCDEKQQQKLLKRLGPDPFSMKKGDSDRVIAAMQKSNRPIKDILLDQSIVVGVGNIYASEALFLSHIDPRRRGIEISKNEYKNLIKAIIDVLHLAYANCGTTFSNYVDGSGKKGDNLSFLRAFQREKLPCSVCTRPIERIKQAGRSTFFCSNCQI